MRVTFVRWSRNIIVEVLNYPRIYLILFFLLATAFIVRVYRLDALLGFYYDQGRDALVIWRLWYEGRPFLIGPVTGLAGIFLGPLYYYLIAPFYLIGGGNPVVPAVFLGFTATAATFMLYYLGWKFHGRYAGLFAATIGAFSYYIVLAGRWLANPTPLLLTSTLLLWSMWRVVKGADSRWWVAIGLLTGISLQFEAASAVFFLPMILIFAVWLLLRKSLGKTERSDLPDKKIFLISVGVFLLTLVPQIAFNFRHENILFNNFKRVLIEERSFRVSFWEVLPQRLDFFWGVFSTKIFPGWNTFNSVFFWLLAAVIYVKRRKLNQNSVLALLLLFILTPMVGLLLFQGNFGNIYDYYLTGVYLPFILLFAMGLAEAWETPPGKLVVVIFFVLFFTLNGTLLRNYLSAGVDGPTHISFGNEMQAVDWVFEDAKKHLCPGDGILRQAQDDECTRQFNVDVYVPPVIPHAYDYLFLWQGNKRCGPDRCGQILTRQVPKLYVLYESDPPHPERLSAWLSKYEENTLIEKEEKFGGITVQRRRRL